MRNIFREADRRFGSDHFWTFYLLEASSFWKAAPLDDEEKRVQFFRFWMLQYRPACKRFYATPSRKIPGGENKARGKFLKTLH